MWRGGAKLRPPRPAARGSDLPLPLAGEGRGEGKPCEGRRSRGRGAFARRFDYDSSLMSGAPRTALVTGANRGLGLETARQLVAHGFRVIVTSREVAAARAAADNLAKV